jgi:hypothetical protein
MKKMTAKNIDAIRIVVRSILREDDNFYNSDLASKTVNKQFGTEDQVGSGQQFKPGDRIGFGPWEGMPVFRGDTPKMLVLKLSDDGGEKTWDKAKSLGAKFVPDYFLDKGRPTYEDLSASVSTNPEALTRNLKIARANNEDDLTKTYPFNSSRSFYVAVDASNPNLFDLDAVESYKSFTDDTLVGLILKNPATGYGKFVKKLPPGDQKKFISALVEWASAASAISGVANLTSALSGGFASPISTAVAGISDAAGAPAWLALSSIALEKGDPFDAAINLFIAAVGGYFAYENILKGFPQALRESDAILKLPKTGLNIKGPGIRVVDRLHDGIKAIVSEYKESKFIKSEGIYYLLPKGASEFLKDESGNFLAFRQSEKLALEKIIKNPEQTLEAVSNAAKIWDTCKSVVSFALHVGLTAFGINYDIEQIIEKITGSDQAQTTDSSQADDTESKIISYTETAASKLRNSIRSYLNTNDHTDFYKKYTKVGQTAVVDSGDLRNVKYVPKMNITPLKDFSPDLIFVPGSYYEVFDELVKFPQSFFGSKNIFYKDGKAVFVFPRSVVSKLVKN